MTAQGLIDTTEMYLRTIFELEEEGVVPLRARIAERLAQSGPTVSQTVARMERDGLLHVAGDRQLSLSDVGRTLATRVMRKHRLAECLLVGRHQAAVGGSAHRGVPLGARDLRERGAPPGRAARLPGPLPARQSHSRPGRTRAARRGRSSGVHAATNETGEAMTKVASAGDARVVIRRIGEQIQSDLVLMLKLKRTGIQPGREVMLMAGDDGVRVTAGDSMDAISTELPSQIAAHIFVSVSSRYQTVAGA